MKRDLWKRDDIKKIGIIVVVSVLLGVLCSMGAAAINYIKTGNNNGKIMVDDSYIVSSDITKKNDKYIISKDGGRITLEFPEDIYISRLQYQYNTEELQLKDSSITIYTKNVYNEDAKKSIKDNYIKNSPRSVINIKKEVSKIVFNFPKLNSELEIYNFLIDNSFKWNPLFAIVVSVLVFIILFHFIFREQNAACPELATFLTILVLATCMLILQPPYCSGWDEQIHFYRSYNIALTFDEGNLPGAMDYLINNCDWLNHHHEGSIEERIDIMRIVNTLGNMEGGLPGENKVELSSIGYLFPAIAISIGKFLHLPFYVIWLLGKFSNILLYAVGMSIAVHIVPIGKRILAMISLFPSMIFLSTTYSYDITVIVFITIGISIWVKEILCKNEVFSYKWRGVYIACMIIGCMPKAVYVPLMICAFFLPGTKFYSKKDKYVFQGIIGLSILLLMSTFVLPAFFNPAIQTDARGGNTSVSEQMKYIFRMPFAYATVLWKSIKETFFQYIIGLQVMRFPYRIKVNEATTYSLLILGTVLTDTYTEKQEHSMTIFHLKYKIGALSSIVCTIVMIWTALYLSFTEIGETSIDGVQGRYYFPFLFLIYLCVRNEKITNKFKLVNYQMFILIVASVMFIYRMSQAFLVPIC